MKFLPFLVIFIFFIFAPNQAYAADTDIVITEIGAYESSDHEWIEIYNKGAASIDLTGWKFFEDGTNHGLTSYRGGFVLPPQAYAIIADVAANTAADYPAYQGILIDSSWTTLNEGGELIGLKSAAGTPVEQFTYIQAPDHSLERISPSLTDYTSANWKEHASSNSIGAQSSQGSPQQPSVSQPSQSGASQQTQPKPSKGSVVINELVSDPSDEEKEWIELYNVTSQAIDLSGWTLTNGSSKTLLLAGMLQASGIQKFLATETLGGMLKNLGDKISLLDSEKNTIDSVSYGSWDDGIIGDNAPRAVSPYALARKNDGYNTSMNSNDFAITTTPTKGAANIITAEPGAQTAPKESTSKTPVSLIISELHPNPLSHNPKDEFIELYNESSSDIDLVGWRLNDEEGSEYVFPSSKGTQIVKSKSFIVLGRDISGIALNNTGGDTVKIYEPGSQKALHTLHYPDTALEGMSYARDALGRYRWTLQVTPGSENAIKIPNRPPNIAIEWPKSIRQGEEVVFDATDTFDPDNDPFRLQWDFGDGIPGEGMYVTHTFLRQGAIQMTLKANDGTHEEVLTQRVTIAPSADMNSLLREDRQTQSMKESTFTLVLNELYPNPAGSDEGEYIEILNNGTTSIDIAGIALEVGKGGRRLTIPSHEILQSQGMKVITKKEILFSLVNTHDEIALFSPSGVQLDAIDYDDAPSGMSYARTSRGDWLWTKQGSPGKANNVDSIYENKDEEEERDESVSQHGTMIPFAASQDEIECTIVVPPGVFAKKKAYCANPPYVLDMDIAHPPELSEGDRVSVSSKISSRNGQATLNVKNEQDISILSLDEEIVAQEKEISELSDADLISLIHVRGAVSRMQWPSLYVKNEDDELRVYFYKTTGIAKPQVVPGDAVELTGILDTSPSGYRLLPRRADDVRIIPIEPVLNEKTSSQPTQSSKGSQKGGYILATLAALAIVSGGLIMQYTASKR